MNAKIRQSRALRVKRACQIKMGAAPLGDKELVLCCEAIENPDIFESDEAKAWRLVELFLSGYAPSPLRGAFLKEVALFIESLEHPERFAPSDAVAPLATLFDEFDIA